MDCSECNHDLEKEVPYELCGNCYLDYHNLQITIKEIKKIIKNIPPFYAYGDNEAGCYMSNMLEEIDNLIQ